MKPYTFQSKIEKILKKLLIFSRKKAILIFRETETLKKTFDIFGSNFQGPKKKKKSNLKKIRYISGNVTFQHQD